MLMEFVRSDGKTLQCTNTRYNHYYTLLRAWDYDRRTMLNIGNGLKTHYNNTGMFKNFLGCVDSNLMDQYEMLAKEGIFTLVTIKQPGLFTLGTGMLRINDRELMDFIFTLDASPTAEFDNHMRQRTTLNSGEVTFQNIEYQDTQLEKCVNRCAIL